MPAFDVLIAGVGQIPVREYWERPLRSLAVQAMRLALADSGGLVPQAVYTGNFLASTVSHQSNLGALLVDYAHLDGIEGFTCEAAGASGAAALHMGVMAIRSGFVNCALVVGVEKFTDLVGSGLEEAVSQSLDFDYESSIGLTAAGQAALVMQRYLRQYNLPADALAGFPLLAHANGAGNPNAMYRKAIRPETYARAESISDPLNLFDMAPYGDGAAAVLLVRGGLLPTMPNHPLVSVRGCSLVTDALALHDRPDPLAFEAARLSVQRACDQARVNLDQIDLVEPCDSFSIYAALGLEAAGLAPRGEGWRLPQEKRLPMLTMGGMKARGNPLGAAGVYQVVEAALQLRGEAGACQVNDARRALVQTFGGPASTAGAAILERVEG